MKIAILSSFYPYRGGIAQFNASLYGSLSRSHDVKAFNFKRQYPDLLFPGKTQYVTPDDAAVPVETESILDTVAPHTYVRTARAVRDWGADLLVMKYWMSWFAPSLGWVARHAGDRCKVVPVLDNVIPHEAHWFDKPLTRYFLKGCDGFVTMSGSVTDDLLYLVPDARYVLLPHPLYSHFGEKMDRKDAEDRLGLQPGMKNLLFFGLIRDYKGLDILLDAFRDLPEDYQLIIAGEPYGSFDKYRAQIDGIPGRDRIHVFPEYVKDAEVGKFFSAADVTVLPYRSATQS
ncbi:MAG: glycosyltransferase, partial [Bacteroidales bacterium]|nr:glycosyltransferase [Bacteroidales bacterium]